MWKKPHNWLIAAAALLVIALLGMDVCHAVNPETGVHYAVAFKDRLIYILFIVLSFIISDVTLLSAKKPFYQVFLAIVNAIVLLGFQIWVLVDFFTTKLQTGLKMSSVYTLSVGAVFPLVAIILLVLAVRFAADEGTAQRIAGAFEKRNL
ncbi:MAG: DUF4293 family protein [Bacteroidales bacterium]|jgi:hypothetical protein|nr:DUF4293 family protein [Bacteroidales bacterium]